jgi:hypothetical protein
MRVEVDQMSKICDVREKIERARRDLDEFIDREGGLEHCYDKSLKLDGLIEEYIEEMTKKEKQTSL